MPLPPALLERLKQRKIIQESSKSDHKESNPRTKVGESSSDIDKLHARYGDGKSSKQVHIAQQDEEEEEIIAADYSNEDRSDVSSVAQDDDSDENRSDSDQSDESQHNEATEHSSEAEYELEFNEQRTQSNRLEDTDDCQEVNDSVIGCPNKYNIYHECNKYCQDQYGSPDHSVPTYEQRKQLALILRAFPLTYEWSVVYDPGVRTFYFWNTVTDQVSWFPPAMSAFTSPSANHIRRTMKQLGEQA